VEGRLSVKWETRTRVLGAGWLSSGPSFDGHGGEPSIILLLESSRIQFSSQLMGLRMFRLNPSFAVDINIKPVLLVLASELDRGAEVESSEGSSRTTLIAPDQLEARLMRWCC
jgi:hypothetical protein